MAKIVMNKNTVITITTIAIITNITITTVIMTNLFKPFQSNPILNEVVDCSFNDGDRFNQGKARLLVKVVRNE